MDYLVKINTTVILPNNEEASLNLELKDDVVTFFLNDKKIFDGDWEANFKQIFKQAMLSFEGAKDEIL